MFAHIASGMIVSVDAFFIGIALGMQKNCRMIYLAAINAVLFALCLAGFFLAGRVYEAIPFDVDYAVGGIFLAMGAWTLLQGRRKTPRSTAKSTVLIGIIMSVEAMFITMGLTLIFLPHSGIAIPITVSLAHFAYSAATFKLVRMKRLKKISLSAGYIVSGLALMVYGVLALI